MIITLLAIIGVLGYLIMILVTMRSVYIYEVDVENIKQPNWGTIVACGLFWPFAWIGAWVVLFVKSIGKLISRETPGQRKERKLREAQNAQQDSQKLAKEFNLPSLPELSTSSPKQTELPTSTDQDKLQTDRDKLRLDQAKLVEDTRRVLLNALTDDQVTRTRARQAEIFAYIQDMKELAQPIDYAIIHKINAKYGEHLTYPPKLWTEIAKLQDKTRMLNQEIRATPN